MSVGFWTDARVREALGLPRAPAGTGIGSIVYSGVSTDTRTLHRGELFVALSGERFDAHQFLNHAVTAGARGLVVSRRPASVRAEGDVQWYVVPDTLVALGKLAQYRRRALGARVCAITGTVGKTTTKEMARAVLAPKYRVHATTGNLNNLVGTPLTLLAAPDDAEAIVVEVGTNAPGEIARLAAIVEAEVGMITAVGEGHLEGLGSVAGVLEEKCSLLAGLRPGGLGIVADTPPQLAIRARQLAERVLVAGLTERADPELRAEDVAVDEDGRVGFRWQGREVRLASRGRANARNALLALGLAMEWGVDPDAAVAALAEIEPPGLRARLVEVGDLRVLADCYNSNPSSLEAALDLLVSMRRGSGRIAVVGSMLELGPSSRELHRKAAGALARADVDLIVATGEFVPAFDSYAAELGDRLIRVEDPVDAYAQLAERLRGGEVILLKGSRGVALERVLTLLEQSWGAEAKRADAPNAGSNGPGAGGE